jgi:hypothetical protein
MNRAVAIETGLIGGPNQGQLLARRKVAERPGQRRPGGAPAGEQVRRSRQRTLDRHLVDEAVRVADRGQHHLVPGLLVGRGGHRDLVGPGKVRDLCRDVPAGRWSGRAPLLVGEVGDHLL